jgi:hypothetical protein
MTLAEAKQTAVDALHDVAHGISPATKKKVERGMNVDTHSCQLFYGHAK